jgi:hypothetical protein
MRRYKSRSTRVRTSNPTNVTNRNRTGGVAARLTTAVGGFTACSKSDFFWARQPGLINRRPAGAWAPTGGQGGRQEVEQKKYHAPTPSHPPVGGRTTAFALKCPPPKTHTTKTPAAGLAQWNVLPPSTTSIALLSPGWHPLTAVCTAHRHVSPLACHHLRSLPGATATLILPLNRHMPAADSLR